MSWRVVIDRVEAPIPEWFCDEKTLDELEKNAGLDRLQEVMRETIEECLEEFLAFMAVREEADVLQPARIDRAQASILFRFERLPDA